MSKYDEKGSEGFLETLAAILWEQMLVTSKVLVNCGDIYFYLTLSMRNVTADLGHLCPGEWRAGGVCFTLSGNATPTQILDSVPSSNKKKMVLWLMLFLELEANSCHGGDDKHVVCLCAQGGSRATCDQET